MGKVLVILGVLLIVVGLLVTAIERGMEAGWRLPGDIEFGGPGWRVWIPLATSLLISLVLTLLMNLFFWFSGRR